MILTIFLICAVDVVELMSGTVIGPNSVVKSPINIISADDFVTIDGKAIGSEKLIISGSGILNGRGLLEAPEIEIVVSAFNFKGTINCSKLCTITVKNSFDQNMFTRLGSGKFTINVDPGNPIFKASGQKTDNPSVSDQKANTSSGAPENPLEREVFGVKFCSPIGLKVLKAIETDDCEQLKLICHQIKQERRPRNRINIDFTIFMMVAGFMDRIKAAQVFIDNGANVDEDSWDNYGRAPLLRAVLSAKPKFIKLLLANSADPNIKVDFLEYIDQVGDLSDSEKKKIHNFYNNVPKVMIPLLSFAVIYGNCDVVRALLESKNIKVDATDLYGRTPLMFAAKYGLKDIVIELLAAGADPTRVDSPFKSNGTCASNDLCNAYDYAHFGKHLDIIDLFINNQMQSSLSSQDKAKPIKFEIGKKCKEHYKSLAAVCFLFGITSYPLIVKLISKIRSSV